LFDSLLYETSSGIVLLFLL